MSKNIEVIGGFNEIREEGEGKHRRVYNVFHERRRVIVAQKDLAALFRRDHELCGMSVIFYKPTTQKPDIGSFSEFPTNVL